MKALLSFVVFIILSALLAFLGFEYAKNWTTSYSNLEKEVVYEFKPKTSLDKLSKDLAGNKIVSSDVFFKYWVKYFANYSKFQAGKYRFSDKITPLEVVASFVSGSTYNPVVFKFTIPEGFTFKQISKKLASFKLGDFNEIISLKNSKDFITELGLNSNTLEGYVYPATYSFIEMPNAKAVIKKAVSEFLKRLPEDYEQRVQEMGLTLDEAVNFASLIELETSSIEEKPLVSEVIWARLKDKVAIGIDATIIYGIKDYKGNITRKHLKDASNLYNSRIHLGLPPTAIGNPDISSLLAVLNPSSEGFYYYVLDVTKPGNKHHFSKSLSEHNTYVRKLIQHSRKNR